MFWKLSERVLNELGDRIQSIVVYGSIARGEATKDSDIDVLVVSRDKKDEEKVSDVSYEVDFENDFETFIMPIHLTGDEFEHRVKIGSPFIFEILKEGVVLYDDGTFQRIREKMFRGSG
ncbi:MAG: nucleotidyltransferase domain-containing protein [Candidatus Bathyarchaeia archaeon]